MQIYISFKDEQIKEAQFRLSLDLIESVRLQSVWLSVKKTI